MLNVQTYLRSPGNTLETLKQQYEIESKLDKEGDRVILNYDQIASPKYNPIVRECRGLVLETGTWDLVAKAFTRFYNYGEHVNTPEKFDWENTEIQEKADGSLILLYHWKDKWCVNSRNSFGEAKAGATATKSWSDTVFSLLPADTLPALNPSSTNVFELCTPQNQVVLTYPKPVLYCTGMFVGEQEQKVCIPYSDSVLPIPSVKLTSQTPEEILKSNIFAGRELFEGAVLKDAYNNRIKVKSDPYLALHRSSEYACRSSHSTVVTNILLGLSDEMCARWPDVKPKYEECTPKLVALKQELETYYNGIKDIQPQSAFAEAAKKCRMPSAMFISRKFGSDMWEVLRSIQNQVEKLV